MKLFLVERTDEVDWDQYSAFVCSAPTEVESRSLWPDPAPVDVGKIWSHQYSIEEQQSSWTRFPLTLSVTEIGLAKNAEFIGVILADFKRG